jgi:uncharacterized NAD(P)/FAD-binding protein YdhS
MKIAIIGSGFSGTLTAVHLLRNSVQPLIIDLYEKAEKNARGVAYSTESDAHFLNVPAGRMSAFPDDPNHFLKWLEETGQKTEPTTFVRRRLYAKYLEKILADAEKQAPPMSVFSRKFREVTEFPADGFYDAVVLATGNFPPRDIPVRLGGEFYQTARSIRDPWAPGVLKKIKKDEPVLLIGTGLTMVDVALELHMNGHQGLIYALSRHGYLPQIHLSAASTGVTAVPIEMPKAWNSGGDVKVREIFSWLRSLEEQWRAGMDSLRPHTPSLWKRLSDQERARFFRHCRAFWDVHRHRLAPQVGASVMKLIADGKLKLLSGRLTRFNQRSASSVDVFYSPRHEKSAGGILNVGYVINCTGPNNDFSAIDSRLIQDLKQKRLISPHPTRLGLQASDDGALIAEAGSEAGSITTKIYAIGSARQGNIWETIAVPELRVQAQELALLLLKMKKGDSV